MNKFQDLQKKWIETKKSLAISKRTNRIIKAENQTLNEKLQCAVNDLQTAKMKLQDQQNEIEILKINIQRLKRIQSTLRLTIDTEKQERLTESVETNEECRAGSFVAESVSVETTAKNSQEAEYLHQIQQFNDEGDEDFNETWVLCSGTSKSEDESEFNSDEFRKEIEDLIE